MPVDEKDNPWRPVDFPDEIEDDDALFRMRFTGEVFLCYEDYLEQLERYMLRTWTCQLSGRGGLTFEEALECEHTVKQLAGLLPECSACEALLLIHRSCLSLDQLVLKLHRNFTAAKQNVFGDNPVEMQKEILRSFILVHVSALPAEGRAVAVRHESLKKYQLTQPVINVDNSRPLSTVKTEGAFSLVKSVSPGNDRPHPLASMSRLRNDEVEGIVAMDTGPPVTTEDADPFPVITGDVLSVWKHIHKYRGQLKCFDVTFSKFYKSIQKSSVASLDYLAPIHMGLMAAIFQEIPRDVIVQSKRLPHYFRRVNEQNWEEKMGTFLVAQDKTATKLPKQFDNVPDSLLGDCCRETGEDWSLGDLNARSKVSLLKLLVQLSLKAISFMSPSSNGTNQSPQVKRKKLSDSSAKEDPLISEGEEPQAQENALYALGTDRCHSSYYFVPTMADRLFVRSKVSNRWSYYGRWKQLDQLMCYLDTSHHGEAQLIASIQQHLHHIKKAMAASEIDEQAFQSSISSRRNRSKSEA